MKVFGVPRKGWTLEQEARVLWDHGPPHHVLVDYEQSSAHKPVSYQQQKLDESQASLRQAAGWKGHISVIGIRVAKEDIEAALAADYPEPGAPTSPEQPVSASAVPSASEAETAETEKTGETETAETETPRSSTAWVVYAIEQNGRLLAGMSVRAASRKLEELMREGKYSPQKPIGWSQIRTIATDQGLLPIKQPQ